MRTARPFHILCSDKTGTLTQNKLTLGEPVVFNGADAQGIILTAALASESENPDAIDSAILQALNNEKVLASYRKQNFLPFNPIQKRAEARIQDANGAIFNVSKGAPQVILDLCELDPAMRRRAEQEVNEFALKGYRALGVASTDSSGRWKFLGILSLYDPTRDDARQTIGEAMQHGVAIKMVTGDNLAIAKQIAGQLGLGQNILLSVLRAKRTQTGMLPPARKMLTASPRFFPNINTGWSRTCKPMII